MNDNPISLTELTALLGTSKPAISRKMTELGNFRELYTFPISNKLYITTEGVAIMKGYFNQKPKVKENLSKSGDVSKELIKVLKEQLETKDKEIQRLTKLLEQEQELRELR